MKPEKGSNPSAPLSDSAVIRPAGQPSRQERAGQREQHIKTQLHITPCAYLTPEVAPIDPEGGIGVKPLYGFWTSTYDGEGSGWVEACKDMKLYDPHAMNWFLLEPDPKARILVIDTLADLKQLLKEYRRTPKWLSELERVGPDWAHRDSMFQYPDFGRISEQWDAMHLTDSGQWATRLTTPSLRGWDSESTLWFRWCFTDCRRIASPAPDSNSHRVDDLSGAASPDGEGRNQAENAPSLQPENRGGE